MHGHQHRGLLRHGSLHSQRVRRGSTPAPAPAACASDSLNRYQPVLPRNPNAMAAKANKPTTASATMNTIRKRCAKLSRGASNPANGLALGKLANNG